MKKSNIKFYDLNESKTEFLFESDAEKSAINEAMRKADEETANKMGKVRN